MRQFTPPFILPEKIQATFFESLNAEERRFYAAIFASLRSSSRQWLALAVMNYRKYGIWPTENRNPFMSVLFRAIVEAEDCAAFEAKMAKMGAVHESSLENLSTRLQKWLRAHFSLKM